MEGKKSVAIGIDLGTTYSRVGVWKGDRVEIIPNDQRSRTTPSCVAFTKIESLVGEAALKQAEDNSTNTIYDAKRLIGRSFMDKQVKSDIKLWPFKIIESPGGYNRPLIEVNYHDQTKLLFAEVISSMIISKMKETAESYLGSDVQVKDAVITVPAYFNDFQRQATIDAAAIAGLNVLQIINEPTAAAIAYGIDKMSTGTKEVEKNVLVFDLGGGTCDVSIIGIRNHVFKVKAVCGDTHLGGEDFDNRMVHHFVAELKNKHDEDISKNHRSLWRLRVECEKAKRGLLLESEACIDVRSRIDNVNFNLKITREEFEDLNKDLFEKCLELVKNCLKEAKMTNKDVDDVVLVGGSSQITKIQSLLLEKNLFNGKKLYKSINPDEDVARGAAVQAAILSGARNNNDIVIEDIIPMSLGIDSYGKDMRVVIPKNVAIPSKKVDKLVTPKDNQEVVTLDVYEGEKRIAKNNNFLGTFEIHGITPTSDHKFDVCFEIDKNGILTVSPDHQGTSNKNQICIIDQRISLSKAEIDRMIKTAKKCKAEDKRFKNLIKSRLALRDYAKKMQELFKDKKKFRGKDTQKVEDAKTFIQDTIKWHDSKINLKRAIEFEDKLKELKKIVDPLIAD